MEAAKRKRKASVFSLSSMQTQQEKDVARGVDVAREEEEDKCISDLKARLVEHEKPLPQGFINFYEIHTDGNTVIRFDELKYSLDVLVLSFLLPPKLRDHAEYYQRHSWGSNTSGFITFDNHSNAKRFLRLYNGLCIPNTDITFKLSWAPYGDKDSLDDLVDEGIQITASKDKQWDVSKKENVDEILRESKALYDTVQDFYAKSSPEKGKDVWSWRSISHSEVMPFQDDGVTRILYIWRADPNVMESDMEAIVERYGKLLSIHLPEAIGVGFVEFDKRESAVDAISCLSDKLADKKICHLRWGYRRKFFVPYVDSKSESESESEDET